MRFFAIALHLVASAAVAVPEHCDAAVDTCNSTVRSASLLQSSAAAVGKTGSLQEREAERQSNIVDGLVERRLLSLAGMRKEGLSETGAATLCHDFVDKFDVDTVDFSEGTLPTDLHASITSIADPLHQMVCMLRDPEGDCESVWSSYLAVMLGTVRAAGTGLLQMVTGQSQLEQKSSQRAETDKQVNSDEFLELWTASCVAGLRALVKGGEPVESVKLQVKDAGSILRSKCDAELPTYMEMTRAEIAKKYFENTVDHFCERETNSCEDMLTNFIKEVTELSDSAIGSLLQLGARSAVRLVMKARGIPDVPEETATERAAATAAYLKHRLAQPGPAAAATP